MKDSARRSHYVAADGGARVRSAYLDCMRGIAMLILVTEHILYFVFRFNQDFFGYFANTVALGGFFFCSGYLAELHGAHRNVGKRCTRLLVALVGWSAVWLILTGDSLHDFFMSGWRGYWFFEVLLVYYLLCEGASLLGRRMGRGYLPTLLIEVMIAVLLWWLYGRCGTALAFLDMQDMKFYFPVYVIGRIVGHYPRMMRALLSPWMPLSAFALWLAAGFIFAGRWLNMVLYVMTAVAALWQPFLGMVATRIAPWLAQWGRASLWIYGFHYFPMLLIAIHSRALIAAWHPSVVMAVATSVLMAAAVCWLGVALKMVMKGSLWRRDAAAA